MRTSVRWTGSVFLMRDFIMLTERYGSVEAVTLGADIQHRNEKKCRLRWGPRLHMQSTRISSDVSRARDRLRIVYTELSFKLARGLWVFWVCPDCRGRYSDTVPVSILHERDGYPIKSEMGHCKTTKWWISR